MKYETATIASLMLDPANVRTHDAKNLGAIKASLARFGQQKPIVVNGKGIVVAGNGTLIAAKMLNWSSVEIVRTDLEGAEAIAYAIADNRTAELAEWDTEALATQLAAIQIDDEELANITGFTDKEIESLIRVGENLSEEIMGVIDAPISEKNCPENGSVWRVGSHVLVVAHPINDLLQWRKHLTDDIQFFVPYPSAIATISDRFKDSKCLFVQPIRKAAGYMLGVARAIGISVQEIRP